jgi:hypothetical protein
MVQGSVLVCSCLISLPFIGVAVAGGRAGEASCSGGLDVSTTSPFIPAASCSWLGVRIVFSTSGTPSTAGIVAHALVIYALEEAGNSGL